MQLPTSVDSSQILSDLLRYRLVQHIRKKKTKVVVNTLLAGCFVFIPENISLPILLGKKDIRRS